MNQFQYNATTFLTHASLLCGVALLTIVLTNSCASHTVKPAAFQDGITMLSSPEPVLLSRSGAVDTVQVWLSCRCLYSLLQTGEGGDTSMFQLRRIDPDTTRLPLHELAVTTSPKCQSNHHYSAWYAFSTIDHFGNTKYDTVHVNGDF